MFIQNCTTYIRGPAVTINIHLLSVNIPRLQPFSSLTAWFSTYKNHSPWSYTSETPFLTSKSLQTWPETTQNWGRTLDAQGGSPASGLPEYEGTNIPYLCQSVHFPVISDFLREFFSKLLATGGVIFSLKIPFRRYQIWPKSIRWKGRYKKNKMQPYHDLAFPVFLYWFWMEWSVPLFTESTSTSEVAVRRLSDCQEV